MAPPAHASDRHECSRQIFERCRVGVGLRPINVLVSCWADPQTGEYLAPGEGVRSYHWGPDVSGTLTGAGGMGGVGGLAMTQDLAHDAVNALDPIGPSGGVFAVYDGHGNLTRLYDSDRRLMAAYEYAPFGEVQSIGGPQGNANPLRFSTKFADAETGLSYYGYRFYSAQMGRWVNRDPIEEADHANLFAFATNCPTLYIDLLGLDSQSGTTVISEGPIRYKTQNPGYWEPENPYALVAEAANASWGSEPSVAPYPVRKRFDAGARLLVFGARLRGLDLAADLLEHYRGNTGNVFSLDMRSILPRNRENPKPFFASIDSAMDYAEHLLSKRSVRNSDSSQETLRIVSKQSYLVKSAANTDLAYSLGHYRMWALARNIGFDFDRCLNSMEFTYRIRDYYDFDRTDDSWNPASRIVGQHFKVSEAVDMHYAGHARAFSVRGDYTINVSWKTGKRSPKWNCVMGDCVVE